MAEINLLASGVSIVRATEREDGTLEVVRRHPSNMAYCNGSPVPDRLIKTIYGARDGRIVPISEVCGTMTPARIIAEEENWQ